MEIEGYVEGDCNGRIWQEKKRLSKVVRVRVRKSWDRRMSKTAQKGRIHIREGKSTSGRANPYQGGQILIREDRLVLGIAPARASSQ